MGIDKKFSKIYDLYVDRIYRFIFLKVNSQEIAQDLCSETFLRGWQSFKQDYKNIENTQAFLYKIARNLIIDHYREKGRTQTVSVENVPVIDPKQDLEQTSLANSDLGAIRIELAKLKPEYQELVIWHYVDDYSISEIASMLDKTEGAVRVSLHRALKSLKKRIPDRGVTDA